MQKFVVRIPVVTPIFLAKAICLYLITHHSNKITIKKIEIFIDNF
jgi:hypothetical protein